MIVSGRLDRSARAGYRRILPGLLLGFLLGATVLPSASQAGSSAIHHPHAVPHQVAAAYSPGDIRSAYNFGPLYHHHIDGSGQTVAVIGTDKLSQGALSAFDRAYGLPAPRLKQEFVGGKRFPIHEVGESDLDVEWLHALAPGAAIDLFYVDARDTHALWSRYIVSALRTITQRGIKSVSISMVTCPALNGLDRVSASLASARRAGVSVFAPSGDNGPLPGSTYQCGTQVSAAYPAGDPSVVAVGGTTLRLTARRHVSSETAWHMSGGGPYLDPFGGIHRQAWQAAPTMPRDASRYVPDVAFVANPATGVSATSNGHWIETGGTSFGAPAWAAIWALLRQNAWRAHVTLGAAPKIIYAVGNSARYGAAFHDIRSGSNGQDNASPGWDPVTGWGTPNVWNLAGAVLRVTKR